MVQLKIVVVFVVKDHFPVFHEKLGDIKPFGSPFSPVLRN